GGCVAGQDQGGGRENPVLRVLLFQQECCRLSYISTGTEARGTSWRTPATTSPPLTPTRSTTDAQVTSWSLPTRNASTRSSRWAAMSSAPRTTRSAATVDP